jgi:hypothetical protein
MGQSRKTGNIWYTSEEKQGTNTTTLYTIFVGAYY